jgi:bifunctional UDP-N-acetylglucosamine pyrophosphorylase/glucosamine-1-phosphate N-acetyltransferase
MDTRSLAVIILAAGQGKRMKSDLAKVLHPILNQPMIVYVVRQALRLDPTEIIMVVGHQRDAVQSTILAKFPEQAHLFTFAVQEPQLGTGHAAMMAISAMQRLAESGLILYGDVPLIRDDTIDRLIAEQKRSESVITILTGELADPGSYGRIIRDERGQVRCIREFRDATPAERAVREINSGIYCLSLEFLCQALCRITDQNDQKEYYLTDVVEEAARAGGRISTVQVSAPHEILGVNDIQQLAEVEALMQRELTNPGR